MRLSLEVDEILNSAQRMAAGANQPLTTAHILIALMKVNTRASAVLADLRVDLEGILQALADIKQREGRLVESSELQERVSAKMHDAARASGASLVTSLPLLLALTRDKRALAYRILATMGVPPTRVRTMALGKLTSPIPRSAHRSSAAGATDVVFGAAPSSSVALKEPAAADSPARPRASSPEPSPPTGAAGLAAAHAPQPEARPHLRAVPPDTAPTEAIDRSEASDDPGARYLLDAETFPFLCALGRNLSADAARGLIDPVVGRGRIIDTIVDVLNKRRSNNPCLVGEPGVGKTAIVEGLARAVEDRPDLSAALRDRVIIALDVGALVAGTELRGSFSHRMAKLKEEVRNSQGRVIVFIDELHTLIGAGTGDSALDAANDLKAALARGDFPCIGATTPKEYHRYIERDEALERRFQAIEVDEPNEADALLILEGIIDKYEDHHGVLYQRDALAAAVRMSARYMVDRRLPDKAFSLVDTAAARAVRFGKEVVEVDDIAAVVSELAQIPVGRLMMSDAERMLTLRSFLGARVIGHDPVLDRVTEVIQRGSAGFGSQRPIGSFLFCGPSGVGKTETAKVLAEFLFGSKEAMTRFDMSELMERHAVSRLLGAAPGYVGHEEAGQLTSALARRPYQIILFDEIEKAHAEVLNVLLQMLDEGRITDAKNRVLDFSNTVIIMTSNLGAGAIDGRRGRRIGFGDAKGASTAPSGGLRPEDERAVLKAVKEALPAELYGRIDEKCVFAPLSEDEVGTIAQLLIAESSRRLAAERRVTYEVVDDVVTYLIENGGFEAALGARPMRRAVQRHCETAVALALLRGEVGSGDHLVLRMDADSELAVTVAGGTAEDGDAEGADAPSAHGAQGDADELVAADVHRPA